MKGAIRDLGRELAMVSALGMVSWAMGVVAYIIVAPVFYREPAREGELEAVLFWSALPYAPFVLFLAWPAMLRLMVDYSGARRIVVLPAAGLVCGLAPWAAWAAIWRAGPNLSPEVLLFGLLFCVATATFGLGYALVGPWVHS